MEKSGHHGVWTRWRSARPVGTLHYTPSLGKGRLLAKMTNENEDIDFSNSIAAVNKTSYKKQNRTMIPEKIDEAFNG